VREWVGRRKSSVHKMVHEIPASLAAHAQAALTIDTCSVWVVAGKKLLTKQPLAREYPEPFPGFEDLAPIPVPNEMTDPRTGELVSTGRGGASEKRLKLWTSAKQLRMTEDRKADRKSTRLNSSHGSISSDVFCLKKKHVSTR